MSSSIALRLLVCLTLVAGSLVTNAGVAAAAAMTVPAQFTDTLVGTAASPTAIAFMPDGRMLVATQGGRLRVGTATGLNTTPALDLSSRICTNSERGLLGVAADPDPASKAIYLYYTARGSDSACPTSNGTNPNPAGAPVNRVSKFVLGDNGVVNPASEVILLDRIHSPAGNHNAGDLAVGKDGYLYVSVGDGGCDYAGNGGCGGNNNASRDRNVLLGKIVRITRSGGVPADNPFRGTGTASCKNGPVGATLTCQETFALGLRNPFRMAFDPNAAGTSFRINDVGQNVWEEIDQGVKGADYGWNSREGHCQNTGSTNCGAAKPAQFTDPIYDYSHTGGCGPNGVNGGSITGGAYVPNSAGWPASYTGAYLFGDYVCGKIFSLPATGARIDFAVGTPNSGGPVHLEFGPFSGRQALFYTTYAGGGEIRRITYTGSQNRPPTAVLGASPTSGAAPLTVAFDASGSTDPDGNPLTYRWDFGDGSAVSTQQKPSHTYAAGSYTATLTVRDSAGATATATRPISSGNTAPTATITSPTATDRFAVGATYTLRGTGTDAQDGALANSRLTWRILQHHAEHTHPYFGPVTGNAVSFTTPPPEDLQAATNSYLEVQLTVTDSAGLASTVTRNLNPATVPVTLATTPAGRTLTVNGSAVTGSTTITSWVGWGLIVSAATQTDAGGRTYALDSWSDSGAASHTYVTPSTGSTLTAHLSLRGLQGAYFDQLNFAGPRVDRLDATVGFNWGRGAPVAGIGADTFSVRWTGQLSPRYSQTYTFATTSDDGIRVWVNGVQVINQWTDHSATVHTGTIALTANVRYAVVVEYYDNGFSAVGQLRWSSGSQASEIVPVERLYPN